MLIFNRIAKAAIRLAHVLDSLATVLNIVAALILIAMAIIMTYGVITRYAFQSLALFVDEITIYLLVALIFFGAAYTLRQGTHVRVDLLTSRFGPKGRLRLRIVTWPVAIAFLAVVSWQTWQHCLTTKELGRTALMLTDLPLWIPILPIPLGLSVFLVAALRLAVRDFLELRKPNA